MFSKNKNNIIKFFGICKHFSLYIAILTVFGVLASLIGVQFAFATKRIIDVACGVESGILINEIVKLMCLLVIQLVIQVANSRLYVKTAGEIEIFLRTDLFSELLKKRISQLEKISTGDLLSRINNDTSVIVSAVVDIIPSAVGLTARLVFSLVALFVLDKGLAIVCVIFAPLVFLASGIFRKKLKHYHKEYLKCEGKVRSFMIEAFNSVYVIKTFLKEKFFSQKAEELQNESFKVRMKKNDFSIMTSTMFFVAVTFGYYIALGWGAYKISNGLLSFGALTAVLELLGQVETPIRSISSLIPQWFAASASMERINELNMLETDADAVSEEEISDWERIDFSCVSFKYGETSILNDFSESIAKGSVVTVFGESGIGKSTLFKLLLGFEKANSGEIVLVKKNGTKCTLGSGTRCMFAYVPQVNLLMSGTIAQNIAFGNLVNYERLKKCAKQAELDGVIRSLPRGFETELGENGLGLSEGEGQRIAIARALYSGAEVLLMDEGTSALDSETEKKIMENIKASGRTCIMISHRDGAFGISDRTIDLGRKKNE